MDSWCPEHTVYMQYIRITFVAMDISLSTVGDCKITLATALIDVAQEHNEAELVGNGTKHPNTISDGSVFNFNEPLN